MTWSSPFLSCPACGTGWFYPDVERASTISTSLQEIVLGVLDGKPDPYGPPDVAASMRYSDVVLLGMARLLRWI
jgi:hypothetical protein